MMKITNYDKIKKLIDKDVDDINCKEQCIFYNTCYCERCCVIEYLQHEAE